MANGVQKVSLSKTRATIDKQRVIGLSWSFGNCKGCRVGKPVRTSGNEVIEVVFGVQAGIKNDPNRAGFPRVFLSLERRSRSNWKDILWGLGNRGFSLNIWVYDNREVGGPTHERILLQNLKDIGPNSLL